MAVLAPVVFPLLFAVLFPVLFLATPAIAGESRIGLYGTVCETESETTALIAKCKENGIGTLLPSLSGGGTVIWKTKRAQYYPALQAKLDAGYDPLADLIKQAHAAGIMVVPSIAIGPGGRMLDEHPEWETRDRLGRPSSETGTPSFSFAFPEARRAKIELLMDLVNGYDVDGILLDYCRYPENSTTEDTKYGYYGYDEPLLETCRKLYGFDPRKEPINSPNWIAFNHLRADTVTAFVKEFRDALNSSGKKIRLAGFGDTDPDLEARSCGRDWVAWGQRGLIDDFYLATYVEQGKTLTEVTQRARSLLGDKVKLHASLTPFNNFVKTDEQMQSHARLLMAGNADGLWIYREDSLTKLDLWPAVAKVNRWLGERKE